MCDGEDNDCDGLVDQADPSYVALPADKQDGVCAGAVKSCIGGVPQEPDYAAYSSRYEAVEVTCDNYDNDCDGEKNEGLTRLDPDNQQGLCAGNREFCGDDGSWYPDSNPNNSPTYDYYTPQAEVCDGEDNDCDGEKDEDLSSAPLLDNQKTICAGYYKTCASSGSWVNDYSVVPGYESPEVSCDNLDNDCDGTTDEGCDCSPGETQDCGYSDVGECVLGEQTCDNNGAWGSCVGAVLPAAETCNDKDDDCDGSKDEGLTRQTTCGVGQCSGNVGVETCSAGGWGGDTCDPLFGASAEVCDGVDNDCDRSKDEGLPVVYADPDGVCAGSTMTCGGVDGWLPPDYAAYSSYYENPEVSCDNQDNDCDGTTDEGCDCSPGETRPCGSDVGSCEFGTQTCDNSGNWGGCVGAVPPSAEVCDGDDNDCDGTIDEGLTRPTSCGVGLCSGNVGVETCSAGGWGGDTCDPLFGASAEVCDGDDNDCDGTIDEGCDCLPGETRPCGSDVGSCESGTQTCDDNGEWGSCVGAISPRAEVCDGDDNDCDGTIDEGLTRPTSCGVGLCSGNVGVETCSAGGWGGDTCDPLFGASAEVCDGDDNDCDGTTDEGCDCLPGETRPCGHNDVGVCVLGEQSCDDNGEWGSCVGAVLPAAETCNDKDDDCDGSKDEGLTRQTTCGVGQCAGNVGVETCTAGGWGGDTCDPLFGASAEVCDGDDNDCDGTTDEGCECSLGETRLCGYNVIGVCALGEQSCDDNGEWGSCVGAVLPSAEVCGDGLDNDCDGRVDEGCDGGGGSGGGGGGAPVEQQSGLALTWSYANGVASASVTDAGYAVKRLFGTIPHDELPSGARLVLESVPSATSLPTGVPKRYRLYRHLSFNDEAKSAVFEEFKVLFTVSDSWLDQQGMTRDGVTVLYASGSSWLPASSVKQEEDSSLYEASLANAPLDELLIVAADRSSVLSNTSSPDNPDDPDDDLGGLIGPDPEEPGRTGRGRAWLWALIIVVLVGGVLVGGYFFAEQRGYELPFALSSHFPFLHREGPGAQPGSMTVAQKAAPSSPVVSPLAPGTAAPSSPVVSPVASAAQARPAASPADRQSRVVPALQAYITKQRAAGFSDAAIRRRLVSVGWRASLVDRHFRMPQQHKPL